jgi:DNA-binding transcriptional LysR family regulator
MSDNAVMHESHIDDLDLNLLLVLQRLFEAGSVTGAAERLGLSQPAVSRALGRLRTAFGDALFVRAPGGLQPTPRAEALREGLGEALARLGALVAGPAPFSPAATTRAFTVATRDYAEAVLLPRLLGALAREAPAATLRVVPVDGAWEPALAEGRWDLLWGPRRRAGAGLIWTHLWDEGFAFVVRLGHPATRRPLTLERFTAIPQLAIAPEGKGANPLDERLARLGARRRVVAQVPSFLVVPALVAGSDLGVTLPRRMVALHAARWGLAALELPFEMTGFDISQAWHERLRGDPAHAWFRKLVAAVAREAGPGPRAATPSSRRGRR